MSAAARVVAVDVGTSAVRAAVVDLDGRVLATRHRSRACDPGGEIFDPAALHRDVLAALRGVSAAGEAGAGEAGAGEPPAALAIAAHIGTVAVDADLEPEERGGGWSDPRGLERLAALDDATVRRILHASGRPSLAGGALARLLERDTEHAASVHAVLSPKDFLVARLTGELVSDTVGAAYTLASDVRSRSWNTALLDELGLDASVFAPQTEPASVVGTLTGPAADATGLPAGLPVVSGGPDGSVGIGLLLGTREDAVADVAGTTDVVGRLLPSADEAPEGAVLNPSVLPGRFVAGGASGLTGGAVARWRSLTGDVEDERIAEVPPGADGLTVLPAMTGARFPRWRPGSRGAVLGQHPGHGPAHLLRAAQEGAAFTVREGLDRLDPSGRLPVVLAGGSARSTHLARLRADALDRPLLISPQPDVTLLGAAALAFLGCGAATDLDALRSRLIGTLREVRPDAAHAARYTGLYARWRALHDAVDRAEGTGG